MENKKEYTPNELCDISKETSREEWVRCPICGNKTRTKLRNDTVLEHFPLHCPKCGNVSLINAQNFNVAVIG